MRRLVVDALQADDLEAGQRLRAGRGGDHAAEPSHRPAAHVVVLGARRDEELLRERHLGDRTTVHGERLEQLRPVAHCLRMLHDHAHRARARAVRDLDPVAAQTWGTDGWTGRGQVSAARRRRIQQRAEITVQKIRAVCYWVVVLCSARSMRHDQNGRNTFPDKGRLSLLERNNIAQGY